MSYFFMINVKNRENAKKAPYCLLKFLIGIKTRFLQIL